MKNLFAISLAVSTLSFVTASSQAHAQAVAAPTFTVMYQQEFEVLPADVQAKLLMALPAANIAKLADFPATDVAARVGA